MSGNRRGQLSKDDEARVDQIASGMTLESCFAAADEVPHSTSLVGFEALLRGLPVSVYGQPFYSGWGLTKDRVSVPRRTRRLDLDELPRVERLVRYPRYYSFAAKAFVKAEDIVFELTRDRSAKRSIPLEATWAVRQLLQALGLESGGAGCSLTSKGDTCSCSKAPMARSFVASVQSLPARAQR